MRFSTHHGSRQKQWTAINSIICEAEKPLNRSRGGVNDLSVASLEGGLQRWPWERGGYSGAHNRVFRTRPSGSSVGLAKFANRASGSRWRCEIFAEIGRHEFALRAQKWSRNGFFRVGSVHNGLGETCRKGIVNDRCRFCRFASFSGLE